MKNRQFNKKYMNIMFRFDRYIAELMLFLSRSIKNSNYGKFQMSYGHKYHYVGSILAVLSLQFVANNGYAAMPMNNVYEVNQLGTVVWTDTLLFNQKVSGSAAASRNRLIRYNSIVYPGATWGMSSDGAAYGFILAPDIILVIDGTASVNAQSAIGQDGTIGGWTVNYSGKALPTVTGSGNNLPQVFTASPGQGDHYWGVGPLNDDQNHWLSITPRFYGNSSVYLGPKAKAGVLTIPNTISMEIVDGSKLNIIEAGTTIEIKKPEIACTVSSPPVIDFGQVSAKGDGWIAIGVQESLVQINCSGSEEFLYNGSISFTASPLYYGRSEMLELTTDGSSGVGILKGNYGINNVSACSSGNSNSDSAVKFNGSVSKTLDLAAGLNEVPITWTICRRGDVQGVGYTSAQATMNLNWD
jgi:hypothetical protein